MKKPLLAFALLLALPLATFSFGPRGGGGGFRPAGGVRPAGGFTPSISPSRPAGGLAPNVGSGVRPSVVPQQHPNLANRPNLDLGNRPNLTPGNRPEIANRPNLDLGNRTNLNTGNVSNLQLGNRSLNNVGDRVNHIQNNVGIANRPQINQVNQNNVFAGSRTNINVNNRQAINNVAVAHRPFYNHYNNLPNNWYHGFWNNWHRYPGCWYGAGLAAGWMLAPGTPIVYSNPYYVAPPTTVVEPTTVVVPVPDYSQPIAAPAPPAAASPPPGRLGTAEPPPAPEVPPDAVKQFDAARDAFKKGDYAKALDQVDRAIQAMPGDATLHEFRALVLFAQKKYKEAAAGIYAVLAAGPGWDWDTLRALYPDVATYTTQLRALEDFAAKNPKAAEGHFLLAYHYLVLDQPEAAAKQLQQVVLLLPTDQLAQQLLLALQPAEDAGQSAPKPQGE